MANSIFAVSALGLDEPGIIAAITQALLELDCNLADTNMSVLNGRFAMVLMVQAPASVTEEALARELVSRSRRFRLDIRVQRLGEDELPRFFAAERGLERAFVSIYGADRPGIVHRATQAIAATRSNIADLRTQRFNPDSALYSLFMEVELAADQSRDALAAALGEFAREFGVQVQVQEVNRSEL